jgi:hypothetical protein
MEKKTGGTPLYSANIDPWQDHETIFGRKGLRISKLKEQIPRFAGRKR